MKSNYLVAFGIAIMMISGFISTAALSAGGDKRSAGIDLDWIDAKTAETTGDRIRIRTSLQIGGGQTLAVDPLGRFVIFEVAHFFDDLRYQALDSAGHASGPMKVLAKQVVEGIDILKE